MRGLLDRNNEQICHKLWEENEHSKSSSWRELAAIEFTLEAFLPFIQDSYVKWFTDSQTVFSIIQVGSMKSELHQCYIIKEISNFSKFALLRSLKNAPSSLQFSFFHAAC